MNPQEQFEHSVSFYTELIITVEETRIQEHADCELLAAEGRADFLAMVDAHTESRTKAYQDEINRLTDENATRLYKEAEEKAIQNNNNDEQ